MSDTFDRSQLDGKDREQLSEIASALGVKAISRMRKADLVDAIVAAAGSNGSTPADKPRRIRSTKPATDDLAALAAEQEALDLADTKSSQDDMAMIRPRRRNGATEGNGTAGSSPDPRTAESTSATEVSTAAPMTTTSAPASTRDSNTESNGAGRAPNSGNADSGDASDRSDASDVRPADADARSRRRRRRAVARRRRRRQPAPAPAAGARPRRSQRTAHREPHGEPHRAAQRRLLR